MEIKVRKLDKNIGEKLDDLAAAQNKSREQYLREQLTLLAESPQLMECEDKYSAVLKITLDTIKENTKTLEELMSLLK